MVKTLKQWKCPECHHRDNRKDHGNPDIAQAVKDAVDGFFSSPQFKDLLQKIVEQALPKLVEEAVQKHLSEGFKKEENTVSYAEIIQKGLPVGQITRLTGQIRREADAQQQRKNNILIRGANLTEDETKDIEVVKDVAEAEGVSLDGVKLKVRRVGGRKPGSSPVLVVTLPMEARHEMLKASPGLKHVDGFAQVFVSPDLTPGEAEADFHLRQELKLKRQDQQDKDWVIRRGRIVERNSA